MTRDPEALASALQLLLGDVPDEEKRALFYKAFPDSFVMMRGDARRMKEQFLSADSQLKAAVGIADGSSPLGLMAVINLRNEINAAQDNIKAVRHTLGL